MGSENYQAVFKEPDNTGRYHLQLELQRQCSLEDISGRAFKLLASEAKQAAPLAGKIGATGEMDDNQFLSLFEHIMTIYKIHFGVRQKCSERSKRDSVSTGKLDCNIDTLVSGVSPFDREQYIIAPGDNHRDSLNRTRVLNIIYASLFRQMSSAIAGSYEAVSRIREKNYDYRKSRVSKKTTKQLTRSVAEIIRQVDEAEELLLRKNEPVEYTNITTVVNDSVKIASTYFKHTKRISEPEIEINVTGLPQRLYVVGDSGDIMHALITLLVDKKHVLKKTENPKVEIMCGSNDGLVFVYLRDNGPKIRFKKESMIFDMAYIESPDERCVDIGAALESMYRSGGSIEVANMPFGSGVEMQLQMIPH
jgi:hypothetical protein